LGAALVLFFGGRVFRVLSPVADHSGQTTRERVKPVDASSTLPWTWKSSPFYREKSHLGRLLLLRQFNNRFLGNLHDHNMIGA